MFYTHDTYRRGLGPHVEENNRDFFCSEMKVRILRNPLTYEKKFQFRECFVRGFYVDWRRAYSDQPND